MTLSQVEKYMPDGLRALSSFLNMLSEAAAACKVPLWRAADWESIGLTLDGLKYWVGVNFSDPGTLWFGTRCRIDAEAAARLGVGELEESNGVPGRLRWWMGAELDSEEIHFFARTKIGQMEWLEGFLRACLEKARAIEAPDQPPLPEVAAED